MRPPRSQKPSPLGEGGPAPAGSDEVVSPSRRPASTRPGASRARRPAVRRGWLSAPANRYAAARWALLALLLVYAILVVGANAARDVAFPVLEARVAQAPGLEGLKKIDENAFQERFDIAPEGLEGWLLYGADEIMNVSELLVAKGDASALARLEDAAQDRVERQLNVFRSYGTNQAQLLDDALTLTRGSYFFYAVGEDAHLWQDAFLAAIR